MPLEISTRTYGHWVCDQCKESLAAEIARDQFLPEGWAACFIFLKSDHWFPAVGDISSHMMGEKKPQYRWRFPQGIMPEDGRFAILCGKCKGAVDLDKMARLPAPPIPQAAPPTP